MKAFNPYINFGGRTREALEFYKAVLSGEIISLQTFAQAQQNLPGEQADKVMHAEFSAGPVSIMASDGMPGQPVTIGNAIALTINFEDESEQTRVFQALAEGGKINMELADTFWGARFGDLTDRFGIQWLLNCYKQPKA